LVVAPELAVDEGPVRHWALLCWWRRRPAIQALLEGAVIEVGQQRPAEADLGGPLDVAERQAAEPGKGDDRR
jgi:hypothetical protein